MSELRSQIVRALLRHFQQHEETMAGEILFLAYLPVLQSLARDRRKRMRRDESEERDEVVMLAFFDAAFRMPIDDREAPTLKNLALKTRQLALRQFAARKVEVPTRRVWEGDIVTHRSPERVLRLREGARALQECEELANRLCAFEADEQGFCGERKLATSTSLRRRFPELRDVEFTRLYQRVRKETSRLAAKIRDSSEETLSQVRDYLDLTVQGDSNAWI